MGQAHLRCPEDIVPSASPSERALIASLAAHVKWATTPDPSSATAAARQAFRDRFEREADPDGVLPPAERARRAEHLRKAFYTRLALKSVQARRKATQKGGAPPPSAPARKNRWNPVTGDEITAGGAL